MSITRSFTSGDDVPAEGTASLSLVSDETDGTGSLLATRSLDLLAGLLRPTQDPSDGPIVVSGFGSADAAGESTLASMHVEAVSVTRGLVSFAAGTMRAIASGAAQPGELAFAAAQTAVDIAGADLAITGTRSLAGDGATQAGTWWSASSTTCFFALDIEGIAPGNGGILAEFTAAGTLAAPIPIPAANIAVFDAVVRAYGDSSLVDLTVDAFAVEDRFSSVNMVFTTASDTAPEAWRDPDAIRFGGLQSDRIVTGSGSDWAFGGLGNDTIDLGAGGNTAFGGGGSDVMRGGAEDDWFFGGLGNDRLELGGGSNIGYGGLGADTIVAGAGNDAIDAGFGADRVDAGNGDNTVRLGDIGTLGDGNDRYTAGSGADWYLLGGVFDRDTVEGFRIAEGDRIAGFAGDWASDAGLEALNGGVLSLLRPSSAASDLVIGMSLAGETSSLRLAGFFTLNADYASLARGRLLTDAEALPLLRDLFVDAESDPAAPDRLAAFAVADMLTPFG